MPISQAERARLSLLRWLESLSNLWFKLVRALKKDYDQTARMHRLLRVFDGCTCRCTTNQLSYVIVRIVLTWFVRRPFSSFYPMVFVLDSCSSKHKTRYLSASSDLEIGQLVLWRHFKWWNVFTTLQVLEHLLKHNYMLKNYIAPALTCLSFCPSVRTHEWAIVGYFKFPKFLRPNVCLSHSLSLSLSLSVCLSSSPSF